ncbi:MAG TPA: diaminopimelate decarboxylase [Bacteroidota bacterium]|nr:diaminopimelate decarboxylase [Bacteroidota bacterium]
MQEFAYRDATLMAESVSLRDVAEEFGTPLYVYSKRSVLDHCRHIERAFDGYPHLSYYAVKANANRELLRLIGREGFGADVASVGELQAALAAGIHAAKITFSGVGKRDDELRSALRAGIHAYNVESTEEIEVLNTIAGEEKKRARILLRVNLDIDAGGHAYVSTSLKQNKFGIPARDAERVLRWATGLSGIEVRGLHSHIGSQITKAETFVRAAEALVGLLGELSRAGMQLTDLDFGGGFGVQYRGFLNDARLPVEEPEELNLSAATLIRTVAPLLKETNCRLSIQPGRSVIAHAGVLLVKVLYRKQTEDKLFIVVDGGMNDLIRPSLYHAHHQIVPLELNGKEHETADIVGPLCESGDFFALDRRIPRVERGDYLALMCAGAYGYVLSSNYNARPRPAEVMVDGTARTLIRRRETIQNINEG